MLLKQTQRHSETPSKLIVSHSVTKSQIVKQMPYNGKKDSVIMARICHAFSSITPLLPRNGAMPPVESTVAPAVKAAAAVSAVVSAVDLD